MSFDKTSILIMFNFCLMVIGSTMVFNAFNFLKDSNFMKYSDSVETIKYMRNLGLFGYVVNFIILTAISDFNPILSFLITIGSGFILSVITVNLISLSFFTIDQKKEKLKVFSK